MKEWTTHNLYQFFEKAKPYKIKKEDGCVYTWFKTYDPKINIKVIRETVYGYCSSWYEYTFLVLTNWFFSINISVFSSDHLEKLIDEKINHYYRELESLKIEKTKKEVLKDLDRINFGNCIIKE